MLESQGGFNYMGTVGPRFGNSRVGNDMWKRMRDENTCMSGEFKVKKNKVD